MKKTVSFPGRTADADTMSAPAVQTIKKLHPETGEVFPFYSIMIVFFSGSGSLTVIKSKNIGKPLKYGFFFVKFLFLYVVCVVIMI